MKSLKYTLILFIMLTATGCHFQVFVSIKDIVALTFFSVAFLFVVSAWIVSVIKHKIRSNKSKKHN